MSRSYRHTPIVKSGRDNSNREFKVEAHQKFRRTEKEAVREALSDLLPEPAYPKDWEDWEYLISEAGPETGALFPEHLRDVSEIWSSKQEYKWKEFGDFWGNHTRDIAQDMVVRPYYDLTKAARDIAWAKRFYIRFFKK